VSKRPTQVNVEERAVVLLTRRQSIMRKIAQLKERISDVAVQQKDTIHQVKMPLQHASRCWSYVLPMRNFDNLRLSLHSMFKAQYKCPVIISIIKSERMNLRVNERIDG